MLKKARSNCSTRASSRPSSRPVPMAKQNIASYTNKPRASSKTPNPITYKPKLALPKKNLSKIQEVNNEAESPGTFKTHKENIENTIEFNKVAALFYYVKLMGRAINSWKMLLKPQKAETNNSSKNEAFMTFIGNSFPSENTIESKNNQKLSLSASKGNKPEEFRSMQNSIKDVFFVKKNYKTLYR